MSQLEVQVADIEIIKLALDDDVSVLNDKLNQKLQSHRNLETDLRARIAKLEPEHASSFEDYFKSKTRLEYMKSHSAEMNSKMVEMAESKKLMVKSIQRTNLEINDLE